jgi:hypothetical protein
MLVLIRGLLMLVLVLTLLAWTYVCVLLRLKAAASATSIAHDYIVAVHDLGAPSSRGIYKITDYLHNGHGV